jgi:putative serine protease PepD
MGFVPTSRPRPTARTRVVGAVAVIAAVMAAGLVAAFLASAPDDPTLAGVEALPTAAPLEEVAPSVVRVVGLGPDGMRAASGVSIGKGQILTALAVVEGSLGISVIGAGGTQLTATQRGVDPVTELALLEVDDGAVPAIELGSARELQPGRQFFGIAASARGRWVDTGTVSALDRAVEPASGPAVPGLVETDLRAAPQHAGGALVDGDGRLIGVLVVPPGDDTSGYVLPVDDALEVALELHATGRARHGWMGVSVADSDDPSGGGAAVEAVVDGSPAARAGLAPGDVIVAIADETGTTAVGSRDKLMSEVRRRRPGEHVELTLYRDGGRRRAQLVLRDRPDIPAADGSSLAGDQGS